MVSNSEMGKLGELGKDGRVWSVLARYRSSLLLGKQVRGDRTLQPGGPQDISADTGSSRCLDTPDTNRLRLFWDISGEQVAKNLGKK